MNVARRYVPLIAFVVPNVIVGFGVVIPRSCIAGVNELTVGFALTMLGACFTYVAGQRAVTPHAAARSRPLRARLLGALNRQAASPRGPMGRLLGMIWKYEHAPINRRVLDALDLTPGLRVLELGCGPGHALAEAARRAPGGLAVGIDFSPLMVQVASQKNRDSIQRGEVLVQLGDASSLTLDGSSFDRIYAVHTIYFWRDVRSVLAMLANALRVGGTLALAFRPDSDVVPSRLRDGTYRFPTADEVASCLEQAGLVVTASRGESPSEVLLLAQRR